jgi:hypothetical protein
MAIFHLTSSIMKRSAGRSVVAAAAGQASGARSCSPASPTPSGLMPNDLWNAVEAREARVDAQLARSIKMALP